MSLVVAVEDEEGAQYVVGPFDDRDEAERVAEEHKQTLRLACYMAHPDDYNHPDDPSVFAWVVDLVEPGPPTRNPYSDEPLVVVADAEARDAHVETQEVTPA